MTNSLSNPSGVARRLVLFAALLLAVYSLVSLGFWQLERGAFKESMQSDFKARFGEPPVVLGAEILDPDIFEYRRATARGEFRPEHQILIDNQILNGRPGYRVMTPLEISGSSSFILVDRGWIPWGSTRDAVPAVPTPSGRVNLSGLLKLPNEDFYTLEKTKPEPGQAVWQHLDMAHYRNLHAFDLQPMILIMSPQSAGGGFERALPTYTDGWVARHRGYALQWFGLAAVLVIVSLALFLRHYRSTSTREVAE